MASAVAAWAGAESIIVQAVYSPKRQQLLTSDRILKVLFRLRFTQLLRRLGLRVPWSYEEIEHEWFGGLHLHWDQKDVERAFNLATRIRGLNWVLGEQRNTTGLPRLPGIGRRGGYSEFHRVYWFGSRMASLLGSTGAEDLINRVVTNDPDANEEATAIHLLRAGQLEIELEIAPGVKVGTRDRRPDFRIRKEQDRWVYVEVTKLHNSNASSRVHDLLSRIVDRMMAVERPFLLEIILNREPTPEEEETILNEAVGASNCSNEHRARVTDIASILVKSGDPRVVIPSLTPDDDRPRMAISRALIGPGRANRQVMARVPFADPRAEDILSHEAKQLPQKECGLVMVNVNSQPTAFESWSNRVPERFTPRQHTRVAGVILFMHATSLSDNGLIWLPHVKLIHNPHAAVPLPSWITETVTAIREETLRLTGRPD